MAVSSPPRSPAGRRPPPPARDAAARDRLALRYVERFATTRGKLASYLSRKIRERGWAGDPTDPPADPMAVAERMAALGYVDDRAFAEARGAALARRGLGARRVTAEWRAAGIAADDAAALAPEVKLRAAGAALAFARRKRIGPYGDGTGDRAVRQRQLAAMLRAGHGMDLARRIVALAPGADLDEQ